MKSDKKSIKSHHGNKYADEIFKSMHAALETYSNVHRGSGHFSIVTTHLYETARTIVLDFLGLDRKDWEIIFLSQRRVSQFARSLTPGCYKILTDKDFGLFLGVSALAVQKKALPPGAPFEPGGGSTRLYGSNWVIWAKSPEKNEAGTPPIINIIGFAKALLLIQQHGEGISFSEDFRVFTADEILFQDELLSFSGKDLEDKLCNTLIGRNVQVPTSLGIKPFINLDNSASTPTFEPVFRAFVQSSFQSEKVKIEIISKVKQIISETLSAPLKDYEVLFTANTTESINIVAQNLFESLENGMENIVLGTTLEHSSNDLPWRSVNQTSNIRVRVDKEGFVDLTELEFLLKSYNQDWLHGSKRIRLVTVGAASNVLGTCNDLVEIGILAHRYGAMFFADAAQLIAHRKVNMEAAGIDFLAFSGHKVYSPFGCGVLVAKKGLFNLNPEKAEEIRISGEENAGGIAALGKALLMLNKIGFEIIERKEYQLTAKALKSMKLIENLKIYGIQDEQSQSMAVKIGVIPFEIKNKMAGGIARKLAQNAGIGIRFGCHCAHLLVKFLLNFTPVQEKIQRFVLQLFPGLTLQGMARVSFGIQNTDNDVDVLIEELHRIAGTKSSKDQQNAGHFRENRFNSAGLKKQINEFVKDRELLVYSRLS